MHRCRLPLQCRCRADRRIGFGDRPRNGLRVHRERDQADVVDLGNCRAWRKHRLAGARHDGGYRLGDAVADPRERKGIACRRSR